MVSTERAFEVGVYAVTNFTGHEMGRISHHWDCPHCGRDQGCFEIFADCHERCRAYGPLFMEETFVGCVISTGEVNGYDDSDFYAVVWNEATQSPERIEYATTRAWCYPNSATVDATPEVLAKYATWQTEQKRLSALRAAELEARTVGKGKTCIVVKGRKIAKGTEVYCVSDATVDQWGNKNILVKLASGDFVKTNVENLKVKGF